MNDKVNNHCAHTVEVIRNKNVETKVAFVKDHISHKEIPANFIPLPRTYENKIFFRINDNNENEYREWISFENNFFYCVYCVCFSSLKKHRLIQGIEYARNCRISDALNVHETELHHKRAISIYLDLVSNCVTRDRTHPSDKRIVLKTIVKIIIFIATHGQYFIRCKFNHGTDAIEIITTFI